MARVPYVTHDDPEGERRFPLVYGQDALNVWKAIDNNRQVKQGFLSLLISVTEKTGLNAHQREVAILTVAAALPSTYVWHQHVRLSLAEGLLEAREIQAIADDDPTALEPADVALTAYTRACVGRRASAAAHDQISRHFDDDTIVGITMLAGSYVTVGLLVDALGVELEGDAEFVGWEIIS